MPQDQWFGLLVKQSDPAKLRLFASPISFTLLNRDKTKNEIYQHVGVAILRKEEGGEEG
jgi:hypothetical protein